MTAVTTLDGIVYGFKLLGYVLAVALLGGAVVLVSGAMHTPVGPVLALFGAAVIAAGGLGMLYKVIADGVETGTLAARTGETTEAETNVTPPDAGSTVDTGDGASPSSTAENHRRQLVEAIRATDPATTEAIAEYVGQDEETVEKWLDRYRQEDVLTARWLGGSKVWSIDEE